MSDEAKYYTVREVADIVQCEGWHVALASIVPAQIRYKDLADEWSNLLHFKNKVEAILNR